MQQSFDDSRTYNLLSIFGFDSFLGLPENWFPGNVTKKESHYKAGYFSRSCVPPPVESDVQLITGWFNETLDPFFLKYHIEESIAFIFWSQAYPAADFAEGTKGHASSFP